MAVAYPDNSHLIKFMKIIENVSIKNFNTFRVECKAKALAFIKSGEELKYIFDRIDRNYARFCVLGGGSNVLFNSEYDGLILKNEISGIRIVESNDEFVILEVGAGEDWSRFVDICLKNKYYGLENLAGIPGNVGSAPVQNIGAYGVEQKDFFHTLQIFDIKTGAFLELNANDCKFGYRNSVFKNELKDMAIITKVRYKLNKKPLINLSYKELRQEIDKFVVVEPTPDYIYNTVKRMRNRKLPDPSVLPNAGSFFKNPIIKTIKFQELHSRYPEIPFFAIGDNLIKIPAGWLIEQCGWKGKRIGDAGVYDKHSLILVNYGNASGQDILRLSMQIKYSVEDKFSIKLENEVNIIGF